MTHFSLPFVAPSLDHFQVIPQPLTSHPEYNKSYRLNCWAPFRLDPIPVASFKTLLHLRTKILVYTPFTSRLAK